VRELLRLRLLAQQVDRGGQGDGERRGPRRRETQPKIGLRNQMHHHNSTKIEEKNRLKMTLPCKGLFNFCLQDEGGEINVIEYTISTRFRKSGAPAYIYMHSDHGTPFYSCFRAQVSKTHEITTVCRVLAISSNTAHTRQTFSIKDDSAVTVGVSKGRNSELRVVRSSIGAEAAEGLKPLLCRAPAGKGVGGWERRERPGRCWLRQAH